MSQLMQTDDQRQKQKEQEYIDNNVIPNISHLDQINNFVPMQVYSDKTPYSPMTIYDDADYMNTAIPAHIDFHYYLKKIGVK